MWKKMTWSQYDSFPKDRVEHEVKWNISKKCISGQWSQNANSLRNILLNILLIKITQFILNKKLSFYIFKKKTVIKTFLAYKSSDNSTTTINWLKRNTSIQWMESNKNHNGVNYFSLSICHKRKKGKQEQEVRIEGRFETNKPIDQIFKLPKRNQLSKSHTIYIRVTV